MDRARDRRRHARRPRRDPARSPASPRLAGRFVHHDNWMRFIGIVHVGVDRLRRDPRDAAGRARRGDRLPDVGRRRGVLRGAHDRAHDPERRRCSRTSRPSPWRRSLPISVGGLGVREGMLALLLHPLGVPTGQAVARRPALVRDDARREPARRARVRGRPPRRTARTPRPRRHRGPAVSVADRRRSGALHRRLPGAPGARATAASSTGGPRSCSSLVFYFVYSTIRNANEGSPRRPRRQRATSSWTGRRRSASTTSSAIQRVGARLQAADHRLQLLLRLAALRRDDRRDDLPATGSSATTTRSGATRSRSRPAIALIGFAFWPLMPPRLLPALVRLRRHARQVPDVLVVQLGRGEQDLQPVRGDAERPLRVGAVVHVRARAAAEAHLGEGARDALPGRHGHRDRAHRATTTSSTRSAASSCSASATSLARAVHPRRSAGQPGDAADPIGAADPATDPSRPSPPVERPPVRLDHVALATRDAGEPARRARRASSAAPCSRAATGVGFRSMQVFLGDDDRRHEDRAARAVATSSRTTSSSASSPATVTARTTSRSRSTTSRRRSTGSRPPASRPVGIDLSQPEWQEAFLLPRDAHGTVVQLAGVDRRPTDSALDEFAAAARSGVRLMGAPSGGRTRHRAPRRRTFLRRVVLTTPSRRPTRSGSSSACSTASRQADAVDGWVELEWPGGGRIRLEQRADRAPGHRPARARRPRPAARPRRSPAPASSSPRRLSAPRVRSRVPRWSALTAADEQPADDEADAAPRPTIDHDQRHLSTLPTTRSTDDVVEVRGSRRRRASPTRIRATTCALDRSRRRVPPDRRRRDGSRSPPAVLRPRAHADVPPLASERIYRRRPRPVRPRARPLGDHRSTVVADGAVGEREVRVARGDEREPPRRHAGDRDASRTSRARAAPRSRAGPTRRRPRRRGRR